MILWEFAGCFLGRVFRLEFQSGSPQCTVRIVTLDTQNPLKRRGHLVSPQSSLCLHTSNLSSRRGQVPELRLEPVSTVQTAAGLQPAVSSAFGDLLSLEVS